MAKESLQHYPYDVGRSRYYQRSIRQTPHKGHRLSVEHRLYKEPCLDLHYIPHGSRKNEPISVSTQWPHFWCVCLCVRFFCREGARGAMVHLDRVPSLLPSSLKAIVFGMLDSPLWIDLKGVKDGRRYAIQTQVLRDVPRMNHYTFRQPGWASIDPVGINPTRQRSKALTSVASASRRIRSMIEPRHLHVGSNEWHGQIFLLHIVSCYTKQGAHWS